MAKVKEDYILANCCNPEPEVDITGYYSHNNIIKVHSFDCPNLAKADRSRLVLLNWADILKVEDFIPSEDYNDLTELDFTVLKHHKAYGFDYSLKIAAMYRLDKQDVFDTHAKLKEMELLERVSPKIIQYRKNIVPGKWIKHRNHTYYDLTQKGRQYLTYNDNH